mmetsp:Transcript_24265/g.37071  ORF Transcript_24265/g.37071 Transcript_24265/m.37071 type:complete len:596 (+) Transcript_24265:122-1909(+)
MNVIVLKHFTASSSQARVCLKVNGNRCSLISRYRYSQRKINGEVEVSSSAAVPAFIQCARFSTSTKRQRRRKGKKSSPSSAQNKITSSAAIKKRQRQSSISSILKFKSKSDLTKNPGSNLAPISDIITNPKFQENVMSKFTQLQSKASDVLTPQFLKDGRRLNEFHKAKTAHSQELVMDAYWWSWNLALACVPALLLHLFCMQFEERKTAFFREQHLREMRKMHGPNYVPPEDEEKEQSDCPNVGDGDNGDNDDDGRSVWSLATNIGGNTVWNTAMELIGMSNNLLGQVDEDRLDDDIVNVGTGSVNDEAQQDEDVVDSSLQIEHCDGIQEAKVSNNKTRVSELEQQNTPSSLPSPSPSPSTTLEQLIWRIEELEQKLSTSQANNIVPSTSTIEVNSVDHSISKPKQTYNHLPQSGIQKRANQRMMGCDEEDRRKIAATRRKEELEKQQAMGKSGNDDGDGVSDTGIKINMEGLKTMYGAYFQQKRDAASNSLSEWKQMVVGAVNPAKEAPVSSSLDDADNTHTQSETKFALKDQTENDAKEEDIIAHERDIKIINTAGIEHSDERGSSTSEVGAVNEKRRWWSNILELMSRKKN